MSTNEIRAHIGAVQAAFDAPPTDIETGLETRAADVLQLRKSCRLLQGAAALLDARFYTLVIEASFVAIERCIEFRLLEHGTEPRHLPGTHTGIYRSAARRGLFSTAIADTLADLWRESRAKTYYQDGLATRTRAEHMLALARETHTYVVNQSTQRHECRCE